MREYGAAVRPGVRIVAFALALLVIGACSSDEDPTLDGGDTTSTSASSSTSEADSTTTSAADGSSTTAPDGPLWEVLLSGAAEVPGPGDPDGQGTATVRLAVERSEVCFTIAVIDIAAPTQAHLHRAPAGQSGDVVLNLAPPEADGTSEGCAAADSILLGEIESAPEQFYVNVHNEEFPQGAVRGQLA